MKQIGLAVLQYAGDYDDLVVASENNPEGAGNGIRSWPSLIYPYAKNEGVFVCPGADETPQKSDSALVSGTRQFVGVTVTIGTSGGDGSDTKFCLVNRLSYGRNLIPAVGTATNPAWAAMKAGRACFNGKTYPGFVNDTDNRKTGWAGLGLLGGGTGTTTPIALHEVVTPSETIHIMDAMAGGPPTPTNSYGASIRGIQQDTRTDLFSDSEASKVAPRHNGGFVVLYGDGHSGWKKWGSSTPCQWTIQDDQCL
ncbi:MAG: hypothetical protein H7Z41_08870 [Cytophagales bacterium]|nr:hypothetical protein [Armatimonadota bacterium]